MKRSKLLLMGFCLAAVLTLGLGSMGNVYASEGPQGGTNSTRPAPSPPVSPIIQQIIDWIKSLVS
jgi:hypothetical protein